MSNPAGRSVAVGAALLLLLAPATARLVAAAATAGPDSYSVNEDGTLTVQAPGVLANDSVDAGTKCVIGVDTSGLTGNLGDQSNSAWGADGSFTFKPLADWNGETSFTYELGTVSGPDCVGPAAATGTVTITVVAVNDPPTAVLVLTCLNGVTVAEDSGAFTDPQHCTELQDWGPVDENTQSLLGWVVSTNKPELFSSAPAISIFSTTFGKLAFTPAPNANGVATVTVRGRDSGGTANGGQDLSPQLSFSLTITPVNDPPTAVADSFFVLKDRTLNIATPGVLINDSDIDSTSITAQLVTPPVHGVLTLAANGSFSYTPAAGYEGPDAFAYRAFDGSLSSLTRVVSLTVTSVPPVATPTPFPTETLTPLVTPEPSPSETDPFASDDPPVTLDPGASPVGSAGESPGATVRPGASPTPGPADGEGGLSLPALLVIVLLVLLLGFGAAVYVPKWIAAQRGEDVDLT